MNFKIETMSTSDIPEMTELWNESFPEIRLSASDFKKQFDEFGITPSECQVARTDNCIAGFAIATDRRIPFIGTDPLPGCLAAVTVGAKFRRKGIGTLLVRASEQNLKSSGVKKIRLGYPTYIRGTILSLIGVDIQWLGSVRFFESLGYAPRRALDSMTLSLVNWQMPPDMARKLEDDRRSGITFETLKPHEEDNLMDFLKEEFPGQWHDQFVILRETGSLITKEVLIVKDHGKIAGFAGPFHIARNGDTCGVGLGLALGLRGRGLGMSLVYSISDFIKKNGGKQITLFSAVDKINYYGKAGYAPAATWLFFEKTGPE
jgi:predicted N-acetyltransferase YhbS